MVSYDTEDRITSLEKDRKQMQTRLENLQYALSVLENQLKNDYNKQNKELYDNLYCIIMGTVIGIVIFVLFAIHH
jgi:hypothetical protein